VPFGARLQTDVINFGPFDVVIWCGGHNDTSYTQAQVQAAAFSAYQTIANAMPNAQQIVFGYNASKGTYGSTFWAVDQGIQAAAAQAGIPFISEINQITQPAAQGVLTNVTTSQLNAPTQYTVSSVASNVVTVTLTSGQSVGTNVWSGAQYLDLTTNAVGSVTSNTAGTGPGTFTVTLTSAINTASGDPLQLYFSNFTTSNGGSLSNNTTPIVPAFYQFGSPSNSNFFVAQLTAASGPTYTLAPGYAPSFFPAGTTITQSGESFLTGVGRVGAPVGWGNCDVYVATDGVHPTDAGHLARGKWMARWAQAVGIV
jgi:lysophospholipase L1-like esterase